MKTMFLAAFALLMVNGESTVIDFTKPDNSGKWYIVNDGVMGGLSKSNIVLNDDGTATFKGRVSLENNGGFASVRTAVKPVERNYKGVVLRVKGDGNIYNLRFRTNNNFDGYAYQAKVKTDKDSWKEFKIPFTFFEPTFRGYTLRNKPALESQNIAQLGLLISDKQSGVFELTIDWIKFYE